jgi:S-adenosylmethionine:tRNA ribosyltransferase-isomerase
VSTALAFSLPHGLEANEPPEARGLARDEVRMMVARRSDGDIAHARFRDLPNMLEPGDLVVVNTSATVAAAIDARLDDGTPVRVHVSHPTETEWWDPAEYGWWVIELRTADGARPLRAGRPGRSLTLAGGARAELVAPYAGQSRLWLAHVESERPLGAHLAEHGRPIHYDYVPEALPLSEYQTVYARRPGSAEMPSAGRPFTPELITRLVAGGVLVAPVVLHTGVSSPERHEEPYPERYEVPPATARLVNAVHGWEGRVVAVGTTVVRALETVAAPDGTVTAGEGWTNVVVTPERGLRAIDGLITGWHEPEASHLRLLEAATGQHLLRRCYREALDHGYLWHEFGDSHLVLP